jgi:hypothetical protein
MFFVGTKILKLKFVRWGFVYKMIECGGLLISCYC